MDSVGTEYSRQSPRDGMQRRASDTVTKEQQKDSEDWRARG